MKIYIKMKIHIEMKIYVTMNVIKVQITEDIK